MSLFVLPPASLFNDPSRPMSYSVYNYLRPGLIQSLKRGRFEKALELARPQYRAISQAVLMRQGAFENVGDDLHVLVPVRPKALARLHPILIDNPQYPEAHILWVVVVIEGEGVAGVQPAKIAAATFIAGSNGDHK